MLNSASIINCSFLHMKEELDQLVAGGTPMFHIDLMDGHYVPNLCMPIKLIEELKKNYPQTIMDVHIMVTDPSSYVRRLADAGADYVSFHTDATRFVRRTINEIRAAGPLLAGGAALFPVFLHNGAPHFLMAYSVCAAPKRPGAARGAAGFSATGMVLPIIPQLPGNLK